MPLFKKRVNKSKEQIKAEMDHLAKVNREKQLVKLIYPFIEDQKTIYDAQTVLGALAGFIKFEMDKKRSEIVVRELMVDLSKEPQSEVKNAMQNILGLIELEKADDVAKLLERFGNTLAQYSANEFMKQPMKQIGIDKIVA